MSVWFTTWPAKAGGIEYADHATQVVRTGTAAVATYFEHGALENSA